MRRRLWLCVLLSVVLVSGVAQAQAGLASNIVQQLKDSVVLIIVTLTLEDGEQYEARGSGFAISADGQIVTNYHVVEMTVETGRGETLRATNRDIEVIFRSATGREEVYPAEVYRQNHELDLAVLKVDIEPPSYLELGDSDAIIETSAVYACGHPVGLREISLRTGTVTAHRTWEGQQYIEHDAMAEGGNSGGPVVDSEGHVIGVHTLTLVTESMMTKFAIPSNVLREWLSTPPEDDPLADLRAGIRELLEDSGLIYEEQGEASFRVPFGTVWVNVHEYDDFLRVYIPLGELPGENAEQQGSSALEALRFSYLDPVGRMSVWAHDDIHDLYWECQVPMSAASGEYLKTLVRVAANQAESWEKVVAGQAPDSPDFLYPGGDEEELLTQLRETVEAADLAYEEAEDYFRLPYENDVVVLASLVQGMTWIHCWTGGMPGADQPEQGVNAIQMLEWNWEDPFGRLSLDRDNDLVWEVQVPYHFLTPDYLAILTASCAHQVTAFWEEFGVTPLNERGPEEVTDSATRLPELLEAAGLGYEEQEGNRFALAYDNDVTVYVHQYEDLLRVYVPLGELPADDAEEIGFYAWAALRFNYNDPVGRMSVWAHEEAYDLYWECQVPTSVATGEYLKLLAEAGSIQAANWAQMLAGEEFDSTDSLYPGGDEEELLAQLKQTLEAADLVYEDQDDYFLLPYDEVVVDASIFQGMVWIRCWTGGMPGDNEAEQGTIALELLERNWDDLFGRLSLDGDDDLIWEVQVPSEFLTPEYLSKLASTCATEVADFWETFGHVPFNAE